MKKVFRPIGLILLSGIFCAPNQVYAADSKPEMAFAINQQKKQVTGTVVDEFGPVAGASVSVKGTNEGTITDMDGNFSLAVNQGTTITISFIGYISQEIKYTGQTSLDIKLVEDTQKLDEVVVTAMGIKKEKRALSYAMSELKSDDIQLVPVQNVANSLYGKAAGVQIAQTAAGPTGGTKIQIRGINSVEGNTRPLIVVDGIPINDTDSNWAGRERDQTQQGSALNDINPDDIESMSILKGANAAALYGSRATNGVIVITTKRGDGGKKGLGIQVGTSYTYDQRAYMPEYQNVFGGGSTPYFVANENGDYTYSGTTYRSFGPRMDGTEVVWWDGVKRPFSPQPNNYRDIFKDGFTNNNSISITNGTDKNNIRLSYTNMNYAGYLENFKQNKHNFSLSGNFKVHERLTFDAAVSFNISDTKNPPTRIDRVSNYPMPRNEITQLWKDHYKNSEGYYLTDEISGISGSNRDNIINYLLWQQNENQYTQTRERLIASLSANVKIFDFLNFRLRGGTDRYNDKKEDKEMFKRYADPANMSDLQGLYRKTDNHYRKDYVEGLLMFNKTFKEDFDVTANLGISGEDIAETGMTWSSEGLKYNGMFSTNNNKKDPKAAGRDTGYNRGEFLGAVFASAQLAYKRFLYLDLTARNDWSSRLSAGNRSFFYPSAGLSFVFTETLDLPDWWNYGKIRGSYAVVGNTTPTIYFTNTEYNYGSFNNSAITNDFGNDVPPTNIIPEKTYSWEFGLESRMFDGRLGFDLAYYTNRTKNQIITVPVAPSTGATGMRMNAGEIGNYGIELQLNGTPVETKNFTWESTLNFSFTHNELISLIDGMEDRQIGSPWSAAIFKAVPGYATPSVFIRKWVRDDQGNMIVDKNGNYQQEAEFTYAGSAAPKMVAGFTNTFHYKNFSLSAHIDGSFGGKLLSFTNNFLKATGAGKESLFGRDEEYGGLAYYIDKNTNQKVALDSHSASAPANALEGRVHHDGMIAEGVKADGSKNDIIVAASDYYNSRYNRNGSEDNLYDNTYIKLRELKLSYQLPNNWVSKIGLQNLNISLIGSNLFYIYKSVPNINPEATLGTSGTNAYVEYTTYPSARSFGFALKTSF
ncbi:SusC/RagA family TonB-linked outer membrane protein [Parabacteroides goldsteinii]|jgi:iron complex outermembrane receptor protein|uniref:SusC/RagA family TonB-linked outer membrane protein n=1 Tax=Parabacteroides goldsteinii TaxID=328812 RepID=UPI001D5E41C0|nr:SusC/RagA family TonB-linked outer membrane protein [Parabacteroides goldsteinii]MBS6574285.1 SusC/RagA family TonB-linked outer membrane protein [Parabacteroides goldsteinii]